MTGFVTLAVQKEAGHFSRQAERSFLATDETQTGHGLRKRLKLGRCETPPSGPADGRAPTNSCIATRYEMS